MTDFRLLSYLSINGQPRAGLLVEDHVFDLREKGNLGIIPGRIEAEDYVNSFGVQTEYTTDLGGGLNVGWIDTGDWMDYNVNVTSSGWYDLTLRVAAASEIGVLEIFSGDTSRTIQVELPVTGGWQDWQPISTVLLLNEGYQTLQLRVITGGFNLNWMEFAGPLNTAIDQILPTELRLSAPYPNPFNGNLSIPYALPESGLVSLRIMDIRGRQIRLIYQDSQSRGEHKFIWIIAAIFFNIITAVVYYVMVKSK